MKERNIAEKLFIEGVAAASREVHLATRGLDIGMLIKMLRVQLGMSQIILAKRAGIPQSTISRIENGRKDMNISILQKILKALSCDLAIAPLLHHSIDEIRRKQAKKVASKHIDYIKGTMNLEEQQPDEQFIRTLLQEEEENLLHGLGSLLWDVE